MDLSKLDIVKFAGEGAVLHLKHPVTGEPLFQDDADKTPMTIRLIGSDSEQFRKQQKVNTDRRVDRMKRNKPLSAQEVEDEGTDMLVACTLHWTGLVMDEQTLEFSPENARKLYNRLPWIREQVDRFIVDRANFLPN